MAACEPEWVWVESDEIVFIFGLNHHVAATSINLQGHTDDEHSCSARPGQTTATTCFMAHAYFQVGCSSPDHAEYS